MEDNLDLILDSILLEVNPSNIRGDKFIILNNVLLKINKSLSKCDAATLSKDVQNKLLTIYTNVILFIKDHPKVIASKESENIISFINLLVNLKKTIKKYFDITLYINIDHVLSLNHSKQYTLMLLDNSLDFSSMKVSSESIHSERLIASLIVKNYFDNCKLSNIDDLIIEIKFFKDLSLCFDWLTMPLVSIENRDLDKNSITYLINYLENNNMGIKTNNFIASSLICNYENCNRESVILNYYILIRETIKEAEKIMIKIENDLALLNLTNFTKLKIAFSKRKESEALYKFLDDIELHDYNSKTKI